MKQFTSFVRKEFRHIFRDRHTMLILLGIPIVMMILFGFAITTEVQNINVAILDTSKGEGIRQIINALEANPYFTVSETIHNAREIERVLQEGTADLVVVFDDRFEEKLTREGKAAIQLIADATDPNTAMTEINYAATLIKGIESNFAASPPSGRIIPNVRMLYNPQMKSAYNFVPGVMGLILMLICAMMTSISIVREKETGTMELLLVSPVKPIYIILSKAVPYFVISCANMLTIVLLAVFVLQVPLAGSIAWLAVISLIYITVCLALGLLISTVAQTQVAAMLISGVLLMMPTLLMSGMIYPVENMPAVLEWFSSIIPARWYIVSVKKLMIQGLDISFLWKEALILSFMAVFLITVSIKKFNLRLQ
jgi:ABC-2 type transport system permease protein